MNRYKRERYTLGVLMCRIEHQYHPWRCIWSDTKDEKPETYAYIRDVFEPFLRAHGKELEVISGHEGVIERWERINVVGSRTLRSCTVEAKIRPIERYLRKHGQPGDVQILGIDAGEQHRAKPPHPTDKYGKEYPLVGMDIDRDGCARIIEEAGLPVPVKSGCWHCPFMRVGEVRALYHEKPELFERIGELERRSLESRPLEPHEIAAGKVRAQWHGRSVEEWRERFRAEDAQGKLFTLTGDRNFDEIPCACFDGDGDAE